MTDTGANTDQRSLDSPASSSGLPSSSSPPAARAATSTRAMDLLCWASVAVITYAWLATKKLDAVPAWGVLVFYGSVVLPGGVLTSIGLALVDRLIPVRSNQR